MGDLEAAASLSASAILRSRSRMMMSKTPFIRSSIEVDRAALVSGGRSAGILGPS